ncbi:MAG: hypothetical protein ACXVJD_04330 [Mucilaginibacter sp.]
MKYFYTLLLVLTGGINMKVAAQKLPGLQKTGLSAPRNIRIDGDLSEWGKLQAYNNSTDIYYTISNDDKKLYLVIRATEHTIVNKILAGGIEFTIHTQNKQYDKNVVRITYPKLDFHHRVWVDITYRNEVVNTSRDSSRLADSFMNAANKAFNQNSKFISIIGIKGADSLTSIYNQDGIKAAAKFDKNLAFNYELSIELTKADIDIKSLPTISYKIRLPGLDFYGAYRAAGQSTTLLAGRYPVGDGKLPGVTDEFIRNNLPSFPHKVHIELIMAPTDFNGTYSIVKNSPN